MKKDTKKSKSESPQPIFEVVIFSLAIVLLIVGVHQTMTWGFAKAYWIFMLMFVFLLLYTYKKGKRVMNQEAKSPNKTKK